MENQTSYMAGYLLFGVLDVRVKLIDGVQINLEMQVRNYDAALPGLSENLIF